MQSKLESTVSSPKREPRSSSCMISETVGGMIFLWKPFCRLRRTLCIRVALLASETARKRNSGGSLYPSLPFRERSPKSICFEFSSNRANFLKNLHQSQYWAIHKTLAQMILCCVALMPELPHIAILFLRWHVRSWQSARESFTACRQQLDFNSALPRALPSPASPSHNS
jgi:hypothetical protein